MNERPITWELMNKGESGEIPERAYIFFKLGDKKIDVRLRNGELIITSSDRLLIKPCASNGIRICVE